MEPLWAKMRPKDGTNPPTLERHTLDVMDAAEALFGTAEKRTRLGDRWLRFFRLTDDAWPKFHATLLAACGLHDWGKANDGFQHAMTGKGPQAIRHEHLSALLIAQPSVWNWLGGNPLLDREVVLSAVLTHHLKAGYDGAKLHGFATAVNQAQRFRSHFEHPDFTKLVASVGVRLGTGPAPNLSGVRSLWVFDGNGVNIPAERKTVQCVLNTFRRDLDDADDRGEFTRRRLLNAVRAAIIAADAAGSGLRRTGQTIPVWVKGTFDDAKAWCGTNVKRVIDQRKDELIRLKGKFKWTDFQDHCADPERVPSRALLLAPCGSGKTLAAWRWIERQAGTGVGHVLFLYPTRATATEGFRDYVSWAPEAEAALMHGTSGFDLERMFENPPEGETRKGAGYKLSEAEQRLFALGFWGRRAFSATVDQFLAFLQYAYGSVCMLPVLADSVVVIDEVHSFDHKMFAALKEFLKEFNVPVLCMTATLPTTRREELVNECGLKAYPDGELPPDLKDVAERPRYCLRRVQPAVAEQAVRDALAAGKRVLWVVNQVKRAHAVVATFVKYLPDPKVTTLTTADGVPVICYHSRFKLLDRVDRHKATMKALKDEPGPALGVTTQVCEMSLDIDVDLLVTEDCPVTSLVQRMGRCNRAQNPRSLGIAGDVLVYEPAEKAPYADAHLTGLTAFLKLVDGKDLSQDDLERAMRDETVGSPPSPGDPLCMFTSSGPYALGGEEEFRDSEEFNRPCVLPNEVGDFHSARPDRRPGLVLPVPWKWSKVRDNENPQYAKLPDHLGVATDGHYHPAVGYCDTPLTEWGNS